MKNPILIGHIVLVLFLGGLLHRDVTPPIKIKSPPKKDTIYIKEEALYMQLTKLWKEHPIDSIKTPKIVLIK